MENKMYNRQEAIENFLDAFEKMLVAAKGIEDFKFKFSITTESLNEPAIKRDREKMHADIGYLFRTNGF